MGKWVDVLLYVYIISIMILFLSLIFHFKWHNKDIFRGPKIKPLLSFDNVVFDKISLHIYYFIFMYTIYIYIYIHIYIMLLSGTAYKTRRGISTSSISIFISCHWNNRVRSLFLSLFIQCFISQPIFEQWLYIHCHFPSSALNNSLFILPSCTLPLSLSLSLRS